MSTLAATATVTAGGGGGGGENESLLPAVDDLERAETDSTVARRLAQEELDELRQQHQQTEQNDYAIATAVGSASWEAYRNDRRMYESYNYQTAHHAPYYYVTNARPKPDDNYCCFCLMFWCFFFWLLAFLLIIVLVPMYVTGR